MIRRLAGLVLACTIPLAGVANAATATPTVHLKPSLHLTDGTEVAVTWKGFDAGPDQRQHDVIIAQCARSVSWIIQADCGPMTVINPGAGHGHMPLAVHSGEVGSGPAYSGGTCGTGKADRKTCVVTVEIRSRTTQQVTQIVNAPIQFDKPA